MIREQILPVVFEKSTDGLLLMYDNGIAIDCNQAAVKLLGCNSKTEIIGHHASEFWPEYQPNGMRSTEAAEIMLNRVKEEGSLPFEWLHHRADGSPLYVEALLTALEWDGQPIFHVNWRDISRRREAEAALAYRHALEKLITKMSSAFINLPAEDIPAGMQGALADLGTFVNADRSYIFLYQDGYMHNPYEWCAEGITPQMDRMQNVPIEAMTWSNTRILRGEILNTRRVADLPPEAQAEKDEFAEQDIQSVLVVPMERRGEVIGFIGFDAVRQPHPWPEEAVDLLRIAAGIIANVLDRRDAEIALREANIRLEHRVQERTQQLEQRRNIAESLRETLAIINSNQTLSDTLDHLVRQAVALTDAAACTLYTLDYEAQTGRIEASANIFEDDVRKLEFDLSSTSGEELLSIIQQQQPMTVTFDRAQIASVRADANVTGAVRDRRVLVYERFSSSLSVPLFVRDAPFGAILLYYETQQSFNDQQVKTVMTLAEQAALAIENARLHQAARAKQAEAEGRRRIAEGLRDSLAVLNSDRSLQDILDFIVPQAVDLLKTSGGALYLLDQGGDLLRVGASYGLDSTYTSLVLPVGGAITGRAVALGEPVSLPNIRAASDLLQTYITAPNMPHGWANAVEQLKRDYNAVLAVPIRTRNAVYGALTLYYAERQNFTDELIALAVAFAGQAALVIENARLRDRIRQAAVVEERNRLARDLHDAVTQTLFSASMIADTLPDLWGIDRADARQQLQRLGQLTRGALAEMRSLLIELRPARLIETDMTTLLQQLIDAAQGRSKLQIALNVQGACVLPDDVKIAVYRVAQEGLNNIMKHARAENAFLSLRCDERGVTLQILDDGRGFDPAAVAVGHFGVQIMQERAAAIGATFFLETHPGEGTDIQMIWRR